MLVKKSGSQYLVEGFVDRNNVQEILFIEKIPKKEYVNNLLSEGYSETEVETILKEKKLFAFTDNYPVLVQDGTTNEELVDVLLHRLKFLQNESYCEENKNAIIKLEEAKMWLLKRTHVKKVNRTK